MNNLYVRYTVFFLLLLILMFYLALNPGKGLNESAYVVAIGLDKGQTNKLKLSLQISNPASSEASNSGSGSSQSSDSIIESIECSSINSGLNLFNSYLSKEINLSHCKVLVISEDLASTDITEYLYTLMNNIEFRSDSNIIICKNSSEMFLKSSKPSLEQLSARYYENIHISSDNTGFTANITFGDFFAAHSDLYKNPVALLGSINTKNSQNTLNSITNNSDLGISNEAAGSNANIFSASSKDSSYLAGQTPVNSENTIETIGLAVFKNGKIVGELNGLETLCYLLISDDLKIGQISIPSPIENESSIDLSIKSIKTPKITVNLVNNVPYIKVKVYLYTRMLSMNKNSNTLNEENTKKIEEYTNKYLEQNISSYLYKTSRDFQADINGLGRYAIKNFLFWNDWADYNWLNKFQTATFEVEVDSVFRSAYLLMES